MLTNIESDAVEDLLERASRDIPPARSFLDALVRHPDPFTFEKGGDGIEFAAQRPVQNRPNRARLKLFRVADGPMTGRVAAFFYKPSQVPFSRDRHSYGVCMLPSSGAASPEIGDWIFFASSGFDPAARPTGLRTAFSFTVPD